MDNERIVIEKLKKAFLYRRINKLIAVICLVITLLLSAKGWVAILPAIILFPLILYFEFKYVICPACKRPISLKGMYYCQYCGIKLKENRH